MDKDLIKMAIIFVFAIGALLTHIMGWTSTGDTRLIWCTLCIINCAIALILMWRWGEDLRSIWK